MLDIKQGKDVTHLFVVSQSTRVHLSRLNVILDFMNCGEAKRIEN